jgi:pentapeptide repeat protein
VAKLPRNIDLSTVDLRGVNLNGVRFDRTFLMHADFEDAELNDVVFYDSWVRHVDFKNASLSNATFEKTDWFNALNLPDNPKDGRPIPYEKWYACPEGHKSADHRAFINLWNRWYAAKFDDLEGDHVRQLVNGWKIYTRDLGLCDRVARRG